MRTRNAAGRTARSRNGRPRIGVIESLEVRALLSAVPAAPLLIQLKSAPVAEVSRMVAASGASLQPTGLPGVYQASGGAGALGAIAGQLAGSPGIGYVEPVQTLYVDATPNDPAFTSGWLWGLNGANGINAPAAWNVTTGSTKVTVADIDTGIDYDHPDLYENVWLNQAEIPPSRLANLTDFDGDGRITFYDLNYQAPDGSFPDQGPGKIMDINADGRIDAADVLAPMQKDANGNDTGYGGWADGISEDGDTAHVDDLVGWNFVNNTNNPFDDNGHGTHTAGTIGAIGNNGVGIVGVNWQVQIMALKFLDASGSGTDLGAAEAIQYAADHGARVSNNSYGGGGGGSTLSDAITYAASKGDVFVAAAGNSAQNTDVTPNYPSAYPNDNIIAVAAIDSNGSLASFSNYGPTTVDIAAPGVGIYSTLPGGNYASWSGTSMATPHVTGTVALLLAMHPGWTYSQLIQQILSTARPDPALAGLTVTGGVIDAGAAVQGGTAQAPAVGDAGFEQVAVGAGAYQFDPAGSAWTFSGNAGISGNDSGFTSGNPPAPAGSQVAFLQYNGSTSQAISGWAAGNYVVTFSAAQRGNWQASAQDFEVLIDGQVVGTFTPSGTAYQAYSTAPFTATAGAHTITFQGLDSARGDNTAFIDQVAVAVAPASPQVGDAGFEQVAVGAGAYQFDPAGSAWTFSGNAGVSGNGSGFTSGNPAAPEGSQVAFLQYSSSFSQVVTGWAAGTYAVTFSAAQRGNYQASVQDFEVLIDGQVVGTFNPADTSYRSYATAAFTVSAGPHTITFQGLDSARGDNTALIDQVAIS